LEDIRLRLLDWDFYQPLASIHSICQNALNQLFSCTLPHIVYKLYTPSALVVVPEPGDPLTTTETPAKGWFPASNTLPVIALCCAATEKDRMVNKEKNAILKRAIADLTKSTFPFI
jgi:hypothetical protein